MDLETPVLLSTLTNNEPHAHIHQPTMFNMTWTFLCSQQNHLSVQVSEFVNKMILLKNQWI